MTPRVKAAGITPHIRESSWSQLQDARTASAGPKARRAQAPCAEAAPERATERARAEWCLAAHGQGMLSGGADDRERPSAARRPSADLKFGGV